MDNPLSTTVNNVKFFSENLKHIRNLAGVSQAEMSHSIGFGRTVWNNYEKGNSKPGLDDLFKITGFFGISSSQLLEQDLRKGEFSLPSSVLKKLRKGEDKGEDKGEFSRKNSLKVSVVNEPEVPYRALIKMPQVITVDSQGNENVVMVPVKARAGYLNGYADPEFITQLPAYRLPGLNNGTFRMFEVDGNSMYDTLYDHDIIIGSFVDQWRDVRDDRVHVIVTKNEGVVVKRVLNRFEKEGKFILKSDNYKDRDQYPPIICEADDIIEIWYGIANLSRQMRPPIEIYKRVIDLEGRFTLLEDSVKKKKR